MSDSYKVKLTNGKLKNVRVNQIRNFTIKQAVGVILKNVEIGEIHLIPSAKDNSNYFNTEKDD